MDGNSCERILFIMWLYPISMFVTQPRLILFPYPLGIKLSSWNGYVRRFHFNDDTIMHSLWLKATPNDVALIIIKLIINVQAWFHLSNFCLGYYWWHELTFICMVICKRKFSWNNQRLCYTQCKTTCLSSKQWNLKFDDFLNNITL
jgi:hypothetical protein